MSTLTYIALMLSTPVTPDTQMECLNANIEAGMPYSKADKVCYAPGVWEEWVNCAVDWRITPIEDAGAECGEF